MSQCTLETEKAVWVYFLWGVPIVELVSVTRQGEAQQMSRKAKIAIKESAAKQAMPGSAVPVRETSKGTHWVLYHDSTQHEAFTSSSSSEIMDKATVRYKRVLRNLADR